MLLTLRLVFEMEVVTQPLELMVRLMLAVPPAAQSDVAVVEPAVDVDDKYMCEMCFDFHTPIHSFLDTVTKTVLQLQQTEFDLEDWQMLGEKSLVKRPLPN